MFKIPLSNKKFSQENKGDRSGNIYYTKNINFDDKGYIKLSHRAIASFTEDDDSDFDICDAVCNTKDGIYFNSDHEFYGNQIGVSTLSDLSASHTTPPTPAVEDDVVYFNGTQVVTDGTAVYYRSASTTWTNFSPGLSSSSPTQMEVFGASLAIGNSNNVFLINTSWTTSLQLVLPTDYEVTSIAVNGTTAYIATRHKGYGEGKLFTWDGTATSANSEYGFGTFEMQSVKKYGNSVAGILSDGRLVQFNGGGFSELGRLPFDVSDRWCDPQNDHSTVSNRGMFVDGDLIYINLYSILPNYQKGFLPEFQSGIWCYDPEVGLHLKYTPSFTKFSTESVLTSNVNTTTNQIAVSSAPTTGTPCIYSKGSTILTPLLENTVYYVIKVDATHIKLAETLTDALAGTAIDLTSTGDNAQYLYYYLVKDYGVSLLPSNRGTVITVDGMNDPKYAERVIFTNDVDNNTGTTKGVFNIVHPLLPNVGYFVTPKFDSENVKDVFQKIYIKHSPLKTDEKIVVKYRTTERDGLPVTRKQYADIAGTWSDTNTFTSTADLSNLVAGDEIEIISGVGAGTTFHISSITENSGTYTVNLDEEFIFASANDTMAFIADNWAKLSEITSSNSDGTAEISLGVAAKWLQLKVELRGFDIKVEELQVINDTFKPSK